MARHDPDGIGIRATKALGLTRNYFFEMRCQKKYVLDYILSLNKDIITAYPMYLDEHTDVKNKAIANYYELEDNKLKPAFYKALIKHELYKSYNSSSQSFDKAIFAAGESFRSHKLFIKIKTANEIYEKEFKCNSKKTTE